MIDTMSISEHHKPHPVSVARQQFNALATETEEMTIDQRLQLGQLAAQIAIGDYLRGIDSNLDTWTQAGLSVHTDQ